MRQMKLRTAILAPLALLAAGILPADGAAQTRWRELAASRQLSGERRLDVDVTYGAGTLVVGRGAPGTLYRLHVRYDEDAFTPVADYAAGRLEVGIDGEDGGIEMDGDSEGGRLDLELSPDVAVALELAFGAGRAQIDLGGIRVRSLLLETGASETRLDVSSPNAVAMERAEFEVGAADFAASRLGNLNAAEIEVSAGVGKVRLDLGGEWQRNARVRVEMGLGSLELALPESVGVRLVRETFLTSFDAAGLVRRGDDYYSANWESAERQVTVDVDAAFGSVRILWTR